MHHPDRPQSRRQFLARLSLGSVAACGALDVLSRSLTGADVREPTRKLGVALVGLGSYATGQLGPALKLSRHCRLAGVVTGSPDKAKTWAREFELPERSLYNYDTMDRIAANPDIDIVYVVTPPGLHAEHTIRAARAGKHVISEKPMAISVAECDAMIAACKAAKVSLSIGYRLHFQPMHQELMRLARDEDFGAFTKMRGGFGFFSPTKTWRMTQKLAGGGPLMDVGIYVIQEACMAKGDAAPVAVTAREAPKTRPKIFDECEETIHFTLEFADGATCDGVASFTENSDFFRADAKDGWFEIDPAYIYSGLKARTSRGPLPASKAHQQAAQIDGIAEAILAGHDSIVPGEMGRRDITITTAIYDAARKGKRVAIAR